MGTAEKAAQFYKEAPPESVYPWSLEDVVTLGDALQRIWIMLCTKSPMREGSCHV